LTLLKGLYVVAAKDIFYLLQQPQHKDLSAFVGFYEIYQGQLYDLLNERKKLFAREDGNKQVVIAGLQEFEVSTVEDLLAIFAKGTGARSIGTLCQRFLMIRIL
jgi:hypothetical protein